MDVNRDRSVQPNRAKEIKESTISKLRSTMQSDRIYENMSPTLVSGPNTSIMTEEGNKEDNTEGSINN